MHDSNAEGLKLDCEMGENLKDQLFSYLYERTNASYVQWYAYDDDAVCGLSEC